MKKNLILMLLSAILICNTLFSQQALWGGANIKSPEINADNSVIFRFQAPDARDVKISGDWMPAQGYTPGSEKMTKDEKGIWSYTTEVLASDLYSYSFIVDGIKCTDPNNVYMIRDVATVTNVLILSAEEKQTFIKSIMFPMGQLQDAGIIPRHLASTAALQYTPRQVMRKVQVNSPYCIFCTVWAAMKKHG